MDTILISGGSGMIGRRLSQLLTEKRYKCLILTRNQKLAQERPDHLHWDIPNGIISDRIAEADMVVNLTGESVADGRWTKRRKQQIISSRVDGTALIIATLKRKKKRLKAFLSASAIGYYGDAGNTLLHEDTPVINSDFLSRVCFAWEEATAKAEKITDRILIYRISTVLAISGGALPKMARPLSLGMAAYLGKGDQYISWIHIDDLCNMIIEGLSNTRMSGVYNACAPDQVTNRDFVIELKEAYHSRALLFPIPAPALKIILGEMSSLVLNSARVSADKILDTGFQFEFHSLEKALKGQYEKR